MWIVALGSYATHGPSYIPTSTDFLAKWQPSTLSLRRPPSLPWVPRSLEQTFGVKKDYKRLGVLLSLVMSSH